MRVLPFGDAALLVEVDGLPEVLALTAAVRTARPAGVLDVVPAARTVLVAVVPGTDLAALRRAVLELPVGLAGESAASTRGRRRVVGSSTEARLWDPDRDPPALLEPGGWCGSSRRGHEPRAGDGGRRPVGPRAGPRTAGLGAAGGPGRPTARR